MQKFSRSIRLSVGIFLAYLVGAYDVSAETALSSTLAFSDLASGSVKGPILMGAFMRPLLYTTPTQRFEGRLILEANQEAGSFEVLHNAPFNISVDDQTRSLPPFDFVFVQDGATLIPQQREPIKSNHRNWEFVLEPGLLWDQPDDEKGYTRAAIPFALQERNANCLHNGVLTFAFRSDGRISRVFYQISSETCPYFKFNSWGVVKGKYLPEHIADATSIIKVNRAETAARLPVRPLSDLITAHPNLSLAAFALAPLSDGDKPTVFGVIVDGVNYIGGCDTRAGPYPFCDVLDLPSYSIAKTVVGAIGLMRLEKLWPGAASALIADYVPECNASQWKGVTFENALDMTTGVYGDEGFEKDETSDDVIPFYSSEHHADKIDFACRHYERKAKPGIKWVYRTTDTYVLGTAMQEFVRQHIGRDKDLYRDILAPLWRELHLSPLLMTTRRTYDDVQQPFVGYGLTFHRDDIVRIARFMSIDNGKIGKKTMLDTTMVRRALQRDPHHRGMSAGYPHFVYVNGVWGRDLAPVLNCQGEVWTPFFAGYGGNSVVNLPNGIQYYYFGDNWIWDWTPAAIEINKIRPMCHQPRKSNT